LQENRSFDSYFGMLNAYRQKNGYKSCADGSQYCIDGIDDKLSRFSNQSDEYGKCAPGDTACQQAHTFSLFKLASTCVDDMSSSWTESYGDINRFDFSLNRQILLDGFVHNAEGYGKSLGNTHDPEGKRAMGYYDDSFLNYYYFMASNFAVSDRWFSPVSSKTVPNRIALFSGGTTEGYAFDPSEDDGIVRQQALQAKTIFELLDSKGVSWKLYYSETGANGFPATTFSYFQYAQKYIHANPDGSANIDSTHIVPISQFLKDAQAGTLPQFAFLEAGYGSDDEHPGYLQSVLLGQKQMAALINGFMSSPSWSDSVFFFTYDEGGGPFDHVPPVPGHTNDFTSPNAGITTDIKSIAVNPDAFKPCAAASGPPMSPSSHCDLHNLANGYGTFNDPGVTATDAPAQQGFAAQLGFRLPNIVISPFTKRSYVSHTPMDHTAVLKFLETRFGLPSLTARDAAQPNLSEFFDFGGKPWATPPTPPAPKDPGQFDPACTPGKLQ
jgi:phospholipase C